jgi:hypothetical protein
MKRMSRLVALILALPNVAGCGLLEDRIIEGYEEDMRRMQERQEQIEKYNKEHPKAPIRNHGGII